MKKSMYIIPATETIEIKASGVLMGSKDGLENPLPDNDNFQTGAPSRRVY